VTRLAPPYRGRTAAAGFVLDPALIGPSEARRRVIEHWVTGAGLYELPGGRWLLTLPAPVQVRCEQAIGLPLRRAGGLTGDGTATAPGTVRLTGGGLPIELAVERLPALDPAGWLDLDGLAYHQLAPVQLPPPRPVTPDPEPTPSTVDIRAVAGVGEQRGEVARLVRELTEGRGRGAAGGRAEPRRSRAADALSRLAMRTPAADHISRRHARYLKELTRQFETRQYGEALRNAIGLGGVGELLRLGLPGRRENISGPSLRPPGAGGGVIPYGPTVQSHLRELYQRAADDLERSGEFGSAAFVLADLLDQPAAAVALLERHGQLELAAELAEARELEPDLVVRLWWRAGRRDRAVLVARTRGAFAAAVQRLAKADAPGARELRLAWAASNREAGDYLGAVEAVWPETDLRAGAVRDIQAGMALGGPLAAHLHAYLLAYRVSPAALAGATALLTGEDELRPARDRFLAALADLPPADPAADRELASVAVRVLAGAVPSPAPDQRSAARLWDTLRERADPVLRADLPPLAWQGPAGQDGPLWVDALEGPGQLPVYDAALLGGRAVLAAHGGAGVRLLTLDGRVRAEWDAPAHRLVVADHGGTALLAADLGGDTWELRRLDLASRRLTPWTTLRAHWLPPSYDGGRLLIVDADQDLLLLDALAARPRVLWRELAEAHTVLALCRGPGLAGRADHAARPAAAAGRALGLGAARDAAAPPQASGRRGCPAGRGHLDRRARHPGARPHQRPGTELVRPQRAPGVPGDRRREGVPEAADRRYGRRVPALAARRDPPGVGHPRADRLRHGHPLPGGDPRVCRASRPRRRAHLLGRCRPHRRRRHRQPRRPLQPPYRPVAAFPRRSARSAYPAYPLVLRRGVVCDTLSPEVVEWACSRDGSRIR
jgi:hypothetical protein